MRLALGDEIGCGRRVLLAVDRIGYPAAGKLEIAKPRRQIGVVHRKPGVEPLDRIDRLWRLVVADPGRYEGKRELVHGTLLRRAGEGRRDRPAVPASLRA
jgi:hypothetical protein